MPGWPHTFDEPDDPLIFFTAPPRPEAGPLAAATFWQRRARYFRDVGLAEHGPSERLISSCIEHERVKERLGGMAIQESQ